MEFIHGIRTKVIIKFVELNAIIVTNFSVYFLYRAFKHYDVQTVKLENNSFAFEKRVSHFSSGVGLLASLDDFYVVTSQTAQLVVIETTHDNYNPTLFQYVQPKSNLCWLRAYVANSLATNGDSWAKLFSTHPSGTYTNQWQIMDMAQFKMGQKPTSGFFTLLEEIPGFVKHRDMTNFIVDNLYWASYNIPYLEEISVRSLNNRACLAGQKRLNETASCWESCARANIFRSRQSKITNLDEFKTLMQYNDWENDPMSEGDPCSAIACRRDLEPLARKNYPSGATDSKVSSVSRVFARSRSDNLASDGYPKIDIKYGPTSDTQPVFCWSNQPQKYAHFGQPDCFDFSWTTVPV